MMSYANENFERFQIDLDAAVGRDDLLWQLRDSLFAEAYYGKARNAHRLFAAPGGDLFRLAKDLIKRPASKIPKNLSEIGTCVLLPSPRSNHVGRLVPFIRERPDCCGVFASGLDSLRQVEGAVWSVMIGGAAKRKFRPRHYLEARTHVARLANALPQEFADRQLASMRVFLSQFFAWSEVWAAWFEKYQPQTLISTFEKAAYIKAFFFAGRESGVLRRIHWIHGLRHASIQATLATELWCMTPGDVRFFQSRLPAGCKAVVKDNPECRRLAQEIGVMGPARDVPLPVRFLFLGPGAERSYTKSMRLADLGVIRLLQSAFGERLSWRFRPHPSQTARLRGELEEAGIAIEDFSTRPLQDDLKWAHAVGSSWSSLLLDLRETGRPIFWVQAEIRNLGSVDELIADGIGVHLDAASGVERLANTFPALGE